VKQNVHAWPEESDEPTQLFEENSDLDEPTAIYEEEQNEISPDLKKYLGKLQPLGQEINALCEDLDQAKTKKNRNTIKAKINQRVSLFLEAVSIIQEITKKDNAVSSGINEQMQEINKNYNTLKAQNNTRSWTTHEIAKSVNAIMNALMTITPIAGPVLLKKYPICGKILIGMVAALVGAGYLYCKVCNATYRCSVDLSIKDILNFFAQIFGLGAGEYANK
jgi:prefoldin subunit 5